MTGVFDSSRAVQDCLQLSSFWGNVSCNADSGLTKALVGDTLHGAELVAAQ